MGFKYGNLEGTRKPFHIGTGADEASAQLQADSTTRGFLMPRMTSAQRIAISAPAEGLQVFDTDVKRIFLYADGAWTREEADSIETALTMYVDGTTGNDANDGLAWLTAKKTLSFLYSGDAAAIPRELNAAVTVRTKGVMLSATVARHTYIDGFYGSGSLSIIGEIEDVVTGLTPTGYDNTITNTTYHSFIEVSGATWTVDAYTGDYIQFTTPASAELYPIMSNSATQLETIGLPDLAGTEVFKIVRLLTIFRSSTIADPVTLVDYPVLGVIKTNNCSVQLNLERINVAKDSYLYSGNRYVIWGQEGAAYVKDYVYDDPFAYSSLVKECSIRNAVSLGPAPAFQSCCFAAMVVNNDINIAGSPGTLDLVLSRCVAKSDKAYLSDGIVSYYSDVSLYLDEVRICNCETGIKLHSGKINSGIDLFIEDCTWGISARNSIIEMYYGAYRFKDNTEAINIVGGGCLKGCAEWCPIYSSGNTNDVVLWNSPTSGGLTFAEVNARTPMANAITGACVIYYDDVDGEWIESRSEYDNTTSGLTAARYQTAIDEVAMRSSYFPGGW